jgi:hypothetical protein
VLIWPFVVKDGWLGGRVFKDLWTGIQNTREMKLSRLGVPELLARS